MKAYNDDDEFENIRPGNIDTTADDLFSDLFDNENYETDEEKGDESFNNDSEDVYDSENSSLEEETNFEEIMDETQSEEGDSGIENNSDFDIKSETDKAEENAAYEEFRDFGSISEEENESLTNDSIPDETEITEEIIDQIVNEEDANNVSESNDSEEISDVQNSIIDDGVNGEESDVDIVNKDEKENGETEAVSEKSTLDIYESHEEKPKNAPEVNEYMKSVFHSVIDNYVKKYKTKEHLYSVLNEYKSDKFYADTIRTLYENEMLKYAQYFNFEKNLQARDDLWLIVGGRFCDYLAVTGRTRRDKAIEVEIPKSYVEINSDWTDPDIIEDEGITSLRKERQRREQMVKDNKLDRMIFEIADEAEDMESSIFDDKRSLDSEFFDGPFYPVLEKVMTTDKYADMSNVKMKVIMNADTEYIPVVDFSTGVRIICIDTNDVDQFQIPTYRLARKTKFSFPLDPRNNVIRLKMLYADSCQKRTVATIAALKKLVAFPYYKDKYKIKINGNYVVAYTTEIRYINMFENGDPDSRLPENSTYVAPKPYNKSIGVIVLAKKSDSDRRAARRNAARKIIDPTQMQVSTRDYDVHFVLSAEYIANDRKLTDPSVPQDQRYVQYIITQYNECNSVLIQDGFQTIVGCIVKEHYAKYGPHTKYSVEFEFDRDSLLTPSVLTLLDTNDGLEPSTYRHTNPMDVKDSYILPPSRLKLEGVFEFEKGRIDRRSFNPSTITAHYPPELYNKYRINTPDGIQEFIRSRGFEVFWAPSPITYDVMPYALNILETGEMMMNLHKVSLATLADRDSSDTEMLLFEQQKLEYMQQFEETGSGEFQKFLLACVTSFIQWNKATSNN